MAIAGLLVHTLQGTAESIEPQIQRMDTMTTYGIHNDDYIVVVAEVHSKQIESEVKNIENIDGVLTIYTTYVTLEDEE